MNAKPFAVGMAFAIAVVALPATAAENRIPMLVRSSPELILPQDARPLDDRWVLIEIPSVGSPEQTAAALADRLGTDVVPDVDLDLATDPRFSEQWPLSNSGQTGGSTGADIDVAGAWAIERGDPGVIVAVIDSGVDLDHPDLVDRLWRNPGETGSNGIDDDGNGLIDDTMGWDFVGDDASPDDELGHGTGVAGIVAAPENGVGIVGVAPGVQILPIRACADSCALSNLIAALDYAIDAGAEIVNMSLGGIGSGFGPLAEALSAAGAADILVVAAAGNSGYDLDVTPYYPAAFPGDHIVAVAATDHHDELADWSNRGAISVDLAAPGVNVLTADLGGWAPASGTSLAAPHVAGVAALVRSLDPTLTAPDVRSLLMSSAEPIGVLAGTSQTSGRLDATAAVREAARPTPRVTPSHPVVAVGDIVELDASASAIRSPGPATYAWSDWNGVHTDGPELAVAADRVGLLSVDLDVTDSYGLTGFVSVEVAVGADFADLTDTVFRADALWLSAAGVTRGCTEVSFCPGDLATRGEVAALLTRTLGVAPRTDGDFDDTADHLFAGEIASLASIGVVRGCAEVLFCPEDPVTRAQLASMLVRAFSLPPAPTGERFFDHLGSVHAADIESLAAAGITRGCNPPANDRFCPEAEVTRGELAAMLHRAATKIDPLQAN